MLLDLGEDGSPAGIVRGDDRVGIAFVFVVDEVADVAGGGEASAGDFVPDAADLRLSVYS
jgi:hypothetical protein